MSNASAEWAFLRGETGLHALLRAVLVALGVLAVAGMPAVLWFHAQPQAAPLPWRVIVACLLPVALAAWALAGRGASFWQALANGLAKLPPTLGLPLAVGLALRLVVLLGLAPSMASDGASYYGLAEQMARDGYYGRPGSLAFWPPGFPLLLVPWVGLGWPRTVVLALFNSACLVLAMTGARALMVALRLSSRQGLVYWSLALWPAHVLCSALPEKELVVIALLPWICVFVLRAESSGWRAVVVAGLLTGVVVLVQPSLHFLPLAALIGLLVWARPATRLLVAALLALVMMLLVIAPWTVRNQIALGQTVLISTNGGSVLYRANNDLATGVYTPRGAVERSNLDEVAQDRAYKQLAVSWIIANPVRFLQFSAGKLLHFMGDDFFGAYAVFRRGEVPLDRVAYLVVRQASALPWLLGWLLMLGWLGQRPGAGAAGATRTCALALVVVLPLVYLARIHAVFESGPKYHLPLLVPYLVLLAHAGGRVAGRRASSP